MEIPSAPVWPTSSVSPDVQSSDSLAKKGMQSPSHSFESMILRSLFEELLPRETELDSGFAGDVWRSMLAEQLGNTVAGQGLIPISSSSAVIDPDNKR